MHIKRRNPIVYILIFSLGIEWFQKFLACIEDGPVSSYRVGYSGTSITPNFSLHHRSRTVSFGETLLLCCVVKAEQLALDTKKPGPNISYDISATRLSR